MKRAMDLSDDDVPRIIGLRNVMNERDSIADRPTKDDLPSVRLVYL
jgi:hypothetical protein